ncbi:MAG: ATP-binding cassette domain-containing protein [Candidatus Eisenbacteria bacterium]|nr:ATP-binding cassette domain-containing protein [Candidatus Eisenbacteria bacterium]
MTAAGDRGRDGRTTVPEDVGGRGAGAGMEARGVSLSRRARSDGSGEDRRRVLRDVSFRVEPGEVFGVIGPSGSGKTSLLRVLNGLEEPDEGEVFLGGASIRDLDPGEWRRRVSTVFQAPVVFPGSVRWNVEYALRLDHEASDAREERVMECLDLVGLSWQFAGREAEELSQGERQRVAIARAIAREPEVLLMDEPTSALDPTSGARILELVRRLHRELDVAIVFVTHVLEQARAVCGRALVLVEGGVVETGPIGRLLDEPRSGVTRMFVEGRLDEGATWDSGGDRDADDGTTGGDVAEARSRRSGGEA